MSVHELTQQEAALAAGWTDREARFRLRALRAEIRAQWLATIEPNGVVIVGRWTIGTVQAKKGQLKAALEAVELPVDSEGDTDEGAQAQLDAARAAILALAEAIPGGELHVTANGYAARGGKRAGEQPTSFVTLGVTVVDPSTGAPRPWVTPVDVTPAAAGPAEGVVDS